MPKTTTIKPPKTHPLSEALSSVRNRRAAIVTTIDELRAALRPDSRMLASSDKRRARSALALLTKHAADLADCIDTAEQFIARK